jgi:hypothetical protein
MFVGSRQRPAAAAEHGAVAVLHRDTHFDKLAEVLTFQGVQLPGP